MNGSPRTLAECATLACLLEVSAPKPGNVYRGADFDDVTFVDFAVSAAVIGPVIEQTERVGVGQSVLGAAEATRTAVGTNTNLGTVLLLAPLAAIPRSVSLAKGISDVLEKLDANDTRLVYEAIRLTRPGGMGSTSHADVTADIPPHAPLLEVMTLAADRDLVARQYADDFAEVLTAAAPWVEDAIARGCAVADAIVHAHLRLMAAYPDSLIARKCGRDVAEDASRRAAAVLQSGEPALEPFDRAVADFDFWLRADGHRRNPGTTADLIAAGLFVLLRENRLEWPLRFYR